MKQIPLTQQAALMVLNTRAFQYGMWEQAAHLANCSYVYINKCHRQHQLDNYGGTSQLTITVGMGVRHAGVFSHTGFTTL